MIICLLALGSLTSGAQINMTLQVPPVGVMVKNQLWNMLLVNTSNRSIPVYISLVLLDEKTNQPVLTGTTLPIQLDKGARQIQAKDLGRVEYSYNGPAIADRDPNGMLPAGNYQACYTVFAVVKGGALVENCIQLAVDPLSPPLLNTPSDEGSSYSAWPQFTWLPPTPAGIFNNLSYDLVLVEVLPGQGKADAVEQNIPVYAGGFIRSLYLNYPSSYKSLDTAKLYAWRIVAMSNGQPVTMSDIWTFRIVAPPKPALNIEHTAYLDLKRGLDASVTSAHKSLKLTYENIPADTAVHFTISSIQDPGNPVVQQGQLKLDRGRNLLDLPLSGAGKYTEQKIYLFQFTNSRNETWTMKFTWSSRQ